MISVNENKISTCERRPAPLLLRNAARLLDQQFWCFGRDILSDGNLLMTYGFERHRPPQGCHGSTCYTLEMRPGGELRLWGFGLCLSDGSTTTFIERFAFMPHQREGAAPPMVWRMQDLPRFERTSSDAWMAAAVIAGALADYEAWVAAHARAGHRARTLRAWFKLPAVAASETAAAWKRIALTITSTGERL